MKPRRPKLKLRGPLERDVQAWIFASLGVEQFEVRVSKNGKARRVSRNTWIADQGQVCLHRNNTGATRTIGGGYVRYGLGVGGADVIGVAYGRPIALEVKREGENPTAEQRRWAKEWEQAGGLYWVVRSPGEAKAALESVRGLASPRTPSAPSSSALAAS